ncbi:MAG: energy-coupling factor ABC transporter ATP-binding protein [Candidatus Hodarchaeota archaeon]
METVTLEIENILIREHEPVVKVSNLSFRYLQKSPPVLKDISLGFFPNKLTVIAGPNGSGKTTLVKHFNGLITPKNGKVTILDHEVTKKNRREIQKLVGLVFQNPDEQIFFPRVCDDIAFGPRNMRLNPHEIEERIDKALEEVRIGHLKDRITFNLSFGEKKKVAFAGILAMDPKIMVLDEPTSSIDPWSKPDMLSIIQGFKNHRTVIVVTHDFDVMKIADRIVLIKEGRLAGDFKSFEEFYQKEFA